MGAAADLDASAAGFAGAALAAAGFTSSFFMKVLMVSFAAFNWPKDGIGGMGAAADLDASAAGCDGVVSSFAGCVSSFFMKVLMVSFAAFS